MIGVQDSRDSLDKHCTAHGQEEHMRSGAEGISMSIMAKRPADELFLSGSPPQTNFVSLG